MLSLTISSSGRESSGKENVGKKLDVSEGEKLFFSDSRIGDCSKEFCSIG